MTTSKITVQRQGRYQRFILHIPSTIVSAYGLHGKFFEWQVGDRTHLTVFVHTRAGQGSTAVCVNRNASGDNHRVSVPKALADTLGLMGTSVDWKAESPTVFTLTVIYPSEIEDRKRRRFDWQKRKTSTE